MSRVTRVILKVGYALVQGVPGKVTAKVNRSFPRVRSPILDPAQFQFLQLHKANAPGRS